MHAYSTIPTEVCPLSQSDIRSLDFAMFRFLMKLFKTNNKDSINDCCSFSALNCQVNEYKTAKTSFDSRYCNLRSI